MHRAISDIGNVQIFREYALNWEDKKKKRKKKIQSELNFHNHIIKSLTMCLYLNRIKITENINEHDKKSSAVDKYTYIYVYRVEHLNNIACTLSIFILDQISRRR